MADPLDASVRPASAAGQQILFDTGAAYCCAYVNALTMLLLHPRHFLDYATAVAMTKLFT